MKDGEIRPLPQNEFYQSLFDGRWVDLDEEEVFRLIDMQRRGENVRGNPPPQIKKRVILGAFTQRKTKMECCLIDYGDLASDDKILDKVSLEESPVILHLI